MQEKYKKWWYSLLVGDLMLSILVGRELWIRWRGSSDGTVDRNTDRSRRCRYHAGSDDAGAGAQWGKALC